MIGDGVTALYGVHVGQLATLAPQPVHCCAYVDHRAIPLRRLDVLPDNLPLCPVDEQDEHVSVVTNDPNHFCTAGCGLEHIATQRDIRPSWVTRQSSLLMS